MGEVIEIEHSKLNIASYGFGKFLTEFMEMAFTVWLYFFYVDTLHVDSLIIGLAVVVYAIWNAVNDPLVGYLTNKPFKFTKKWGRRFPWIMIGGIAYILSSILIFTPPDVDPQSGAWIFFMWFVASTAIFDTFNSIFFVNFSSLFPDKFRGIEAVPARGVLLNAWGLVREYEDAEDRLERAVEILVLYLGGELPPRSVREEVQHPVPPLEPLDAHHARKYGLVRPE